MIRVRSAQQTRARSASIPKRLRVNNQIRIPKVQVIDENGEKLGTMETYKALQLTRERGLDLVEVDPSVNPSVCKIMDYGKHLYKEKKQEKKHKAKQHAGELKAVRISIRTGEHDLEFKAKQVAKFLKKDYKVRIELTLRGREKSFQDLAREKINKFLGLIDEPYKTEQEPKRSPSGFMAIVSRAHEKT